MLCTCCPVSYYGLRRCSGTPTHVMDVREEELQDLYIWVDGIPLSRPKKNIARDFSDGGVCQRCRSVACICSYSPPPSIPHINLCSAADEGPAETTLCCHAVLMAEVVHNFYPRLVELHNYRSAPLARAGKHLRHNVRPCSILPRLGGVTECVDRRSAANGMAQKLYNWSTLNTRVFKRLGFVVAQHECEVMRNILSCACARPFVSA